MYGFIIIKKESSDPSFSFLLTLSVNFTIIMEIEEGREREREREVHSSFMHENIYIEKEGS